MIADPATTGHADPTETQLLDAALRHVAFDGWSERTLRAACRETGISESLARSIFPRGAVDLAIAFHKRGDAQMVERLRTTDMTGLRFRDKISAAVRIRLEVAGSKEAVRRGATLFSLPQYAPDGAKALWSTADAIWTALGDTSDDLNWYTKRTTLAGVYGSTLLMWLGDDSLGSSDTWAFLDRRIGNVMQFEKVKSRLREAPFLKPFTAGPEWLFGRVRAPMRNMEEMMPGRWSPPPAPGAGMPPAGSEASSPDPAAGPRPGPVGPAETSGDAGSGPRPGPVGPA